MEDQSTVSVCAREKSAKEPATANPFSRLDSLPVLVLAQGNSLAGKPMELVQDRAVTANPHGKGEW